MKSLTVRRSSPNLGLLRIARAAGVALLASLSSVGCQSGPTSRLQDNAAVFQSLDVVTQGMIRQGHVDFGFSSDLVIMALGQPNHVELVTTGTGLVEIWAYRNFLNATSNGGNVDAKSSATQQSGGLPGLSGGLIDLRPGRGGTRSLMSTLTEANENPPGTLVLELLDGRVVAIRIEP